MLRLTNKLLLLTTAGVPVAAWSHASDLPHVEPGWTLTPSILIPLAVTLFLFGVGVCRLQLRSQLGRAALHKRTMLFAAGWLTLAGAAVSPLHEAGETSFTLHMLEHELLMLVAAPLLVLSRPLEVMLWALPTTARKGVGRLVRSTACRGGWRLLSGAVTTTILQAAALWLWHVPALFERALSSDDWHIAQHLSFLISALLFWTAMLRSDGRALAALCLFATSVVSGALGALMAFAQSPWYARYVEMGLAPFGLTPIEDQQLAGLLMWIPGGVVHAVAALLLLGQLLRDSGGSNLGVTSK